MQKELEKIMKKKMLGIILITIMLSFLFVFPFMGTFFSSNSIAADMNKDSISPFFLKNEQSHIVFVYFGYVGCADICVPSLQEISNAYKNIKMSEPLAKVYFVNLNPEQSPDAPDLFAKGFNEEFKGVYASQEQIESLARTYNLAITGTKDAIGHSSSLYMFVKTPSGYILKYIYSTYPYPIEQILVDLKKVQND